MAAGDPSIPSKMGWVSEGGKFMSKRRWNGEGQREGAGFEMVMRDPPISGKMGWVSEGGKFVGGRG